MMEFWPFTNFHDLNLDWIIKKIRNVEDSEAAAKASEEAAAESAGEAQRTLIATTVQATRAKTYAEHSADSAEASADSAASIAGVVDQVNTNTGRISELIAHAGDGTIPSELTDIRIDDVGAVYPTAGDATRSEAFNNRYDPFTFTTEPGTFDANGNILETGPNHQAVITSHIPVEPGDRILLKLSPEITSPIFYIGLYRQDGTWSERLTPSLSDNRILFEVPTSAGSGNRMDQIATIRFNYSTKGVTGPAKILKCKPEKTVINYWDNIFTYENTVPGYLNVNGTVNDSDGGYSERRTLHVPITAGQYVSGEQYGDNTDLFMMICFYDSSDNLIGSRMHSFNTKIAVQAPANSAYFMFSARTANSKKFNVTVSDTLPVIHCYAGTPVNEPENPSAVKTAPMYDFHNGRRYNVLSINHRGYNTVAPENTIPAYEESAAHGFNYVETDIRFTSDGVPVLLHDPTINRTARNADGSEISGTIAISSITYAQALTYDFGIWKGAEYAGTKIPTLSELLVCCKKNGLYPYLEMNSGLLTDIQTVLDTVERHGFKGGVTYIGGVNAIRPLVTMDEEARIGLVCSPTTADVDIAASLKSGRNEVFVDVSNIDSTLAVYAASRDIPCEVYGLNTSAEISTADPYITGFTTDQLLAYEHI